MAEERTLGQARARDSWEEDPSKEELQRRMEQARDSITNTVTEIKENVAQQVETVKDALDWREHFKKRPVAWSLGAAGAGFFVGYGIAACLSDDDAGRYVGQSSTYAGSLTGEPYARSLTGEVAPPKPATTNGKDDGPGLIERFRETFSLRSVEQGSRHDRRSPARRALHHSANRGLAAAVEEASGLDWDRSLKQVGTGEDTVDAS